MPPPKSFLTSRCSINRSLKSGILSGYLVLPCIPRMPRRGTATDIYFSLARRKCNSKAASLSPRVLDGWLGSTRGSLLHCYLLCTGHLCSRHQRNRKLPHFLSSATTELPAIAVALGFLTTQPDRGVVILTGSRAAARHLAAPATSNP